MLPVTLLTFEHPQDVLQRLLDWHTDGLSCALVVVTQTEGGAVRAPGALMCVNSDGQSAGYISGGCIDADVRARALKCIETGSAIQLLYGKGSPFIDLPLPCGGAIQIRIVPIIETQPIRSALSCLETRSTSTLYVRENNQMAHEQSAVSSGPTQKGFAIRLVPKIRLRVAGRGADCLALASLARQSGIDLMLQLTDEADIEAARRAGITKIEKLTTSSSLRDPNDDVYTAFVLMFHDGNWETDLLAQACHGPAFYVGAVGSQRTHSRRMDELRKIGTPEAVIRKVRGPIGLVSSLRDASWLAISTLAEIIESFQCRPDAQMEASHVVLLAAGASSRFQQGDKLLSGLNGKPILQHISEVLCDFPFRQRIAVVAPGQTERRELLHSTGWTICENPEASSGQASSLRTGLENTPDKLKSQSILVVLADMPLVPEDHFKRLYQAFTPEIDAIMSETNGVLSPPALFRARLRDKLCAIEGDRGAKSVFLSLEHTRTVNLCSEHALDIDTVEDLRKAEDSVHA